MYMPYEDRIKGSKNIKYIHNPHTGKMVHLNGVVGKKVIKLTKEMFDKLEKERVDKKPNTEHKPKSTEHKPKNTESFPKKPKVDEYIDTDEIDDLKKKITSLENIIKELTADDDGDELTVRKLKRALNLRVGLQ